MGKKAKKSKKSTKKESENEKPDQENEKPGFPEDVDFKKFLGCGG
ncbi:hypothetical protein [Ekhidna sp.]